jgi:hypothetical protein
MAGQQGPRPLELAGGLRIYVDAEGRFKFFSTIEGVAATTDYSSSANVSGTDFGLRNVNGVEFDFHRTFGVYAHFGESVFFKDWLRFDLHLGLGVQVRFP